jgi:PAS domain S-box-containing protein
MTHGQRTTETDRNLLFGVFVLQADLIGAAQFVEACSVWAARKTVPLADVLVERGWLSRDDKARVEHLIDARVKRSGADLPALLGRLPEDIRQSLANLADDDIQRSLGQAGGWLDVSLTATSITPRQTDTRYANIRLHAIGGIGQVWLARDNHLDRDVALKELKPDQTSSVAARARFLREAQITAQLEHPGIVPVYELVPTSKGQHFYTMRFVRGQTLNQVTRAYHERRAAGQSDSLEFLSLLGALVAICNTLAYAHSRGVIHRDVKGQNVILGKFGEVVLLDWGLAKLLDTGADGDVSTLGSSREEPYTSDLTAVGQALGTPAYMAPEQAAGRLDQIDGRTDVYGLGAMLYEILTGKPPFVSSDTREVIRMVRETEPVPPSRHWPEVPPLLESACLRALSKDPARRFATPTELAEEVQKWQEVQRQQAEDALRASEALYHSLVETIPMNVWRKDAAGRFTFANRGFCQTMGIPVDDLIGKTDFDLFPTGLAEGYRQGDIRILTTGTTYEAIEEVINAKGERQRIQIVKLPVRDGQGNIIGTQGIFWTT